VTTVYLGLGSNVGDCRAQIEKAIELLTKKVTVQKLAPLYRTKPFGLLNQADFLNSAIMGQTDLNPEELLAFVKEIEQQVGRVKRVRWGPREIDIDIIMYGSLIYHSHSLTIPHPGFVERDSVLVPLIDLDPELRDPVSGKTVTNLLKQLPLESRSVV
jgi:2-amino-4-hydroxy-6-hydroxymethyldihydropteridine diphosphokinase